MRTAIYARVSTTDQNCDMQLRELREYCRVAGGKLPENMSIPVGVEQRQTGPNWMA